MKFISQMIAVTVLAFGLSVSAKAQVVLLGGYDGNQTQNTIPPAGITSNSGVRELVGGKQDAAAVGNVSTRIWTDQTTGKELQWSVTSTSTTTGDWGLTDFVTDAATGANPWVITQTNPSWINFEITNTGANDLILDKLHLNVLRTNIASSGSLTISLQQNGTFANPPVLSASDLTAVAPVTFDLAENTSWNGYEIALSGVASTTLGAGETATFRIANNDTGEGANRIYYDNVAISGSIIPEPSSALLIMLGLGGLFLLRRSS
jgi:hypothetical protein